MFEYIKDCKDKDTWDGRTSVRISNLSKRLISIVDSNYNIGSKTNTFTSLVYIGAFRFIGCMDKEQWNTFVNCNANQDMEALSLFDKIGTDNHSSYYDSMFALNSIGYMWVDVINKKWSIPDKKRIIYHMYSDHRAGKVIDIVTDKMGFSVKEAVSLFILYALYNSDCFKNASQSDNHLVRIDEILNIMNSIFNKAIKEFNEKNVK